ncbi:MAG TPA: DUF4342 domain-containing protein [Rhodothermales bacterium]|nr:DUF4342 domain-containing protein [Rhodothermales bacterium]
MAKDQNSDTNDTDEGGASRADQFKREAARVAGTARTRATEAFAEAKVASNELVDRVRELIEEGSVRRIVIKRGEKTLLEIPLTVGVGAGAAAVLFTPVLAAVGALAALVSDITLVVERDEEEGDDAGGDAASESGTSSGGDASAKGDGGKADDAKSDDSKGDGGKTVGRGSGS